MGLVDPQSGSSGSKRVVADHMTMRHPHREQTPVGSREKNSLSSRFNKCTGIASFVCALAVGVQLRGMLQEVLPEQFIDVEVVSFG